MAPMATEETDKERVEREYCELLEEIRVALPGVEVMFGFLLTVPFNERFSRLDVGQKQVYFLSLLCIALGTILLLAPSAYHRLRFQAGDKEWITRCGNVFVILAMVLMVPGIGGTLYVVTDVIVSHAVAMVVAIGVAALMVGLWFMVPLARKKQR